MDVTGQIVFKAQAFQTAPRRMLFCLLDPSTSINNYQHTLRNNPEERRPHLHRSGGLKACAPIVVSTLACVI